jgi:hypothetical protein
MSIRSVLGLICLLLPQVLPGQAAEEDDVNAFQRSCRIVQMTLAARERQRAKGDIPENDEFTDAAKGCEIMEKALTDGDSAEVKKASQSLRSTFALLGVPPSTPRETICCPRKESHGLEGPRSVLRAQ